MREENRGVGDARVRVPPLLAEYVEAREGAAGRRWAESLPELIRLLTQLWKLDVVGSAMHGHFSLVVPVHLAGKRAALKLSPPSRSYLEEVAALMAWEGKGAVRLLAASPEHGAMLLEWLDPDRTLQNAELLDGIQVAGELLRRLAVDAPSAMRALGEGTEKLPSTLVERWERLGRPVSEKWIRCAIDTAAGLLPVEDRVMVNYDLHYGNVLGATREKWLAIDPRVVAGELEFAIAPLLWGRIGEIVSGPGIDDCFRAIVDAAEVDAQRSKSWILIRIVQHRLWGVVYRKSDTSEAFDRIIEWLEPTLNRM